MRNLLIFFYCISAILSAQSNSWWIYFDDKSCDNSINLSERSIERRIKQNIKIDIHDYPICANYIDSINILGVEIRNHC